MVWLHLTNKMAGISSKPLLLCAFKVSQIGLISNSPNNKFSRTGVTVCSSTSEKTDDAT